VFLKEGTFGKGQLGGISSAISLGILSGQDWVVNVIRSLTTSTPSALVLVDISLPSACPSWRLQVGRLERPMLISSSVSTMTTSDLLSRMLTRGE
jgi:hypothetical protein